MIKVAIIGITGFGSVHLEECITLVNERLLELKAVCDLKFSEHQQAEFKKYDTNLYTDFHDLLHKETDLDFVIISTPIHLHADMTVAAMNAGLHVLVEKPPAAVIQDTIRMIDTSLKTKKRAAVNYMQISPTALETIKNVIYDNRIGKIKRIKAIGIWKRLDSYYERAAWAGKLIHNEQYVLDGTLNNPLSHLLFNAVTLAELPTEREGAKATPLHIQAELYKGHKIEAEDTSCLKVNMSNGLELFFFGTLCASTDITPYIEIEGTHGTISWDYDQKVKMMNDAGEQLLLEGERLSFREIYVQLANVANGHSSSLYCPLEDTRSLSLVANGAFVSSQITYTIPDTYINRIAEDGSFATLISHIDEIILDCAKNGQLFSEAGVPWAKTTTLVDLKNFTHFSFST